MTAPFDRRTAENLARQVGLQRIGANKDVTEMLVDPAQPLNRAQRRALAKSNKKEARRG